MKRFRLWLNMTWRFALAISVGLVLFAVPVGYLLFASAPLHPWVTLASWQQSYLVLRIGGAVLFICAVSAFFGFLASRAPSNAFQDLATILRQIGTGDFRVRIGPYGSREPREFAYFREAINTMAADLEHAEELRNNLMADVAHELRTPLTALEGNLRAALDRVYPLDESEIANLYSQTRHLIRLVHDLHELSLADARQLPLHMQPTDLNALLSETLQIFTSLAIEQGIALRITTTHLPTLTLDVVRIRQVLHNLLTNALRHTPSGGEIAVSSCMKDQQVVIAVSDTGDGLEPEQLGAVFNRFYRTDKSRSRDTGGTGLGLAIVNAIVNAHDGSVSAFSAGLGQGSTFTITLPMQ